MIKAIIYTALALSFLALTMQMVIGGFDYPGFNSKVMVTVSSAMAAIMFLVSWGLWKSALASNNESNIPPKTPFSAGRVFKVIFASYGVAFASSILIVVAGMWLFGFEEIHTYIKSYMGISLLVITVACSPIVNRYLL